MRLFKFISAVIVICSTAFTVSSQTFTDSQGIVYNILTEPEGDQPGTCEVGNNQLYVGDGIIKISSTVSFQDNQYSVIGIASNAFSQNKSLKEVDLEDCASLQTIGSFVFNDCSSLTTINLSGCFALTTIMDQAFHSCSMLESIDLTDCTTLQTIGAYAFYQCGSLKYANLNDLPALESIGAYAFYQCGSLKYANLNDLPALESIGSYVFNKCNQLIAVDLSGCTSLETIGNVAFDSCSNLEVVDLSGCTSLITIGSSAFSGCSALTKIDLSPCVLLESIGISAFSRCSALTSIDLSRCTELSTIGNSAFFGCSSLTSVESLSGNTALKTIGMNAFNGCSALTSVDLSDCKSLESIGDNAFNKCSLLTTVNFSGCSSLKIMNNIFSGCTELTSVDLSGCTKLTEINNTLFSGLTELSYVNLSGCRLLQSIGNRAFSDCQELTSIDLSGCNSLTRIENSAFESFPKLTTVSLSGCSSLQSIGKAAFYNCSALTTINMTGCFALTTIMDQAFQSCSMLESIDLTDCTALQTIGAHAFDSCTSLTSIDLSGCTELTAIGDYAFFNCSALKSVGSLSDKTALKTIGANAFYYCTALQSIDLSGCTELTTIGNYAFNGCSALTSVDLSDCKSLESILSNTFSMMVPRNNLTSVNLSGCTSLKTIESSSFYQCSQLLSLDLSSCTSLQTIGNNAFWACGNIQEIKFPASLEEIGSSAFMGCGSVNNTYCYAVTPPVINFNTFARLGTLWVPIESVEDYANDQYWGVAKSIKMIIDVPITQLTLDHTDITMAENVDPVTVKAAIAPDDASYPVLEWSLSEDGIVELIPVEGTTLSVIIKPLTAGTVTLTVKTQDYTDLTASCRITISEITGFEIKAVSDSGNENEDVIGADGIRLRVNQTAGYTAVTIPEVEFGPEIVWALADEGTALMSDNSDGVSLTGQSIGKTTLTVSMKDNPAVSTTVNVTVVAENPITSLRIEPAKVDLPLNAPSFALEPVIEPSNATIKALSWTSSNPNVATVDNEGNVIPKSLGSTTITATTQDGTELSATCEVTISAAIADSFEFEFDESVMGGVEGITLEVGDTYQFVVKPSDASHVLPDNISWTSSDTGVALIDVDGWLTALGVGNSIITASATVNGKTVSASCELSVIPVTVKTLTLSSHLLTIGEPTGETLSVNYSPMTAEPELTWSVADGTILSIVAGDQQTYVTLKPLNAGKTIVKVEADGQSDECEVTVLETASIGNVWSEGQDGPVDVYDLMGRTVKLQASPEDLKTLRPGVYVLQRGSESTKVIIR